VSRNIVSGRVLRRKGNKISETEFALVVREHKPYILKRTILDAEIPSGMGEEMIKMVCPEISKEALELLKESKQIKKTNRTTRGVSESKVKKDSSDSNKKEDTRYNVMAEALEKAGVVNTKQ